MVRAGEFLERESDANIQIPYSESRLDIWWNKEENYTTILVVDPKGVGDPWIFDGILNPEEALTEYFDN